jgi:thiamine pyrophosphate-dependent acetolactate synthase large subunit-like protein
MIRKDAIIKILEHVGKNPIVAANGFISRDLFNSGDKDSNFYMIGSMGLASSISLGISLENPKKRIFVFDGDGNILMNLGSLTTIGSESPKNLIHIVFDNSKHESTGGQPTNSSLIHLEQIAKVSKYKAFKVKNIPELEKILKKIKNMKGPIFILVKIDKSENLSNRVDLLPTEIKERFTKFLKR